MKISISTLLILITFTTVAQPTAKKRFQRLEDLQLNDSSVQKKWTFNTFTAVSTSFIAFRGGNATMVSAPMGVQVNRFFNKNVFAFANLSIAPTYINYRMPVYAADPSGKGFGNSFNAAGNMFTVNPRAQVGIGYTNDERTWQITGSFSVERTPLPFGAYNQFNSLSTLQQPRF